MMRALWWPQQSRFLQYEVVPVVGVTSAQIQLASKLMSERTPQGPPPCTAMNLALSQPESSNDARYQSGINEVLHHTSRRRRQQTSSFSIVYSFQGQHAGVSVIRHGFCVPPSRATQQDASVDVIHVHVIVSGYSYIEKFC